MTTTHVADQQQLTVHARDYLRVSLDRSGRARSLEQQHADHEQVATEQGWILGESYRDESVSASRYSRKTRDDFGRLIADCTSHTATSPPRLAQTLSSLLSG